MSAHNLLQNLAIAPFIVKDPGDGETIAPDRWGMIVPVVTASAETRILASPAVAGLQVTIGLKTDGGDLTLTVTNGYNTAGTTTITFDDAGDWVTLQSVKVGSNYRWRVVAQEGTNATVTNVTATTATLTTATITTLTAPTAAAEHGAGAIGTGVAPVTSRRTENGVIITDIKIDLTGLKSKDTANDVIGLAAGGAAYIGRNVVATNGVIYKMELICLEAPATGDDDINVVAAAAADLAYDGAGGTVYGVNGGDQAAGQVVANLVQGLTANHYFYLTAGTGDTAATYTAGQIIVRMYGHALLT